MQVCQGVDLERAGQSHHLDAIALKKQDRCLLIRDIGIYLSSLVSTLWVTIRLFTGVDNTIEVVS